MSSIAEREGWLNARKKGIGGSDVAAILGLSKWRTPFDVYLDKIGDGEEQPDNDAMLFGRLLEPVLLQHYSRTTGYGLLDTPAIQSHPQHPWMLASLDGATSTRIVEIKTARSGDDWGEIGTDQIPDHYMTQVHHYMMVTGHTVADVAVLIGGSDFRIYTVHADAELHGLLFEEERQFWQRVLDRNPPDPVTAGDVIRRYPKPLKSSVEAVPDVLEKVVRLADCHAQIKELEKIADGLKTGLQLVIGENEGITIDGKPLITWKAQESNRFDQKTFQTEHKELFEIYKKTSSTRVFRMVK